MPVDNREAETTDVVSERPKVLVGRYSIVRGGVPAFELLQSRALKQDTGKIARGQRVEGELTQLRQRDVPTASIETRSTAIPPPVDIGIKSAAVTVGGD